MEDRVMRAIIAVEYAANVTAGMTRCFHVPEPVGGKIGSLNPINLGSSTENNNISMSPSQNTGVETPMSASSIPKLSTTEYGFVAERIPRSIPTADANSKLTAASSNVCSKRRHTSGATG